MKHVLNLTKWLFIITTCLFVGVHVATHQVHALQTLAVYPKDVTCGEKLRIGLNDLEKNIKYKVVMECTDLACNELVEPIIREVIGKTNTTLTESFDINGACLSQIEETTPSATPKQQLPLTTIPAGRYSIKLYKDADTAVLAQSQFRLIADTTSCSIKTRSHAVQGKEHLVNIVSPKPCVYSVTLVNPAGQRTTLTQQFINATSPFKYKIKGELLATEGVYKLSVIAGKECTGLVDRECKDATILVSKSTTNPASTRNPCAYNSEDNIANCLQCGVGAVCTTNNTCNVDATNTCDVWEQSNQDLVAQTNKKAAQYNNMMKTGILVLAILAITAIAIVFILVAKRYRIKTKQKQYETNETKPTNTN